MKLLGIDYGDSKVGLATGDTESHVASPFTVIKNSGWTNLIEQLAAVCQTEQIAKIIIGLPVNGESDSEQVRRIKDFAARLALAAKLPVDFQDERLTTQAAQKLAPPERDDEVAAMLILQSYLDLKGN